MGLPVYKMVDTCAAEFPAKTLYFHSTYGDKVCEITHSDRKKSAILDQDLSGSDRDRV